jgi:alkanesulfonate monooxygenase SsuD/methylene tetrahydromethanopterin reductase-like flavin-dependent oxidoreductase (luciferase family)
MKYGFVLPYGDARTAADMAREAEAAGWDAFFVWEPVWGIDAWVCLSAAAMTTTRIKLGTMLTPLSRMRPWKLASETATLDNLSGGRVILSVGLGAVDTGFAEFGEETDRKTRAELLDESLEILTGLWKGQPFSYTGKHYTVKECKFYPPPPPIQQPRIPIWAVGAFPRPKSMRRALKYDGLLPQLYDKDGKFRPTKPQDLPEITAYIAANRESAEPYDIVVEGTTPGDQPEKAAAIIREWEQAGATWWNEALWEANEKPDGAEIVRQRLLQGPPKI